jgi:hypothetical protein
MTSAAGAPLRPLAVLGGVVLAAHFVLLQGAPAKVDWRHLRGTLTFSVHDRPQAAVPAQLTVQRATAETRAEPQPPTRAPRAAVGANTAAVAATPAAQPAAPAAGPRAATLPPLAFPPATTWRYAVTTITRGTVRNGTAELAWTPAGERYDATLRVDVPGGLSRSQASEGALTAAGLEPLRFSQRVRSEEATHFDRAQSRIVFSSNRPDAVLQPGAQDRLSVLLQVGAMLAADPARFARGATLTLQTATTREAIDWTFTVAGEEPLVLPGGTVPALLLTRAPQREYDLRIEAWFAPGADYGLVRLRLTPPNGDWLDMQWSGTDKR